MYPNRYTRRHKSTSRPPVDARTASSNRLFVATSEEDGYELTVRPSSSSSSSGTGSRTSKSSGSSRNSFRNPFRRRNTSKRQRNRPSSVVLPKPSKPSQLVHRPAEADQAQQISPPVELRLQLLPRIAEFKERCWLSTSEEKYFMKILADQPVDFENTADHAAIQVKEALDLVEKREEAKRRGDSAQEGSVASTHQQKQESRVVLSPQENSQQQTKKTLDKSETGHSTRYQEEKSIIRPAELKLGMSCESKVEEIFVEMCFFARLGFIQPPSCMRCIYRESMNDRSCDKECQRWVAWRNSAKTHLHPHKLEGNITMVKCHAARSLIEGKRVHGYEWDSKGKMLCCDEE